MDKHKAKNIVLGVSLALNVLGSLLIGGALIKSCNAPENAGNASLSVSNVEKVKLYGSTKDQGAKPLFTHDETDEESSSGVGYLDFSDLSKWSGSTWLWKGTLSPFPTSIMESYLYNKVIYDQNGNEYANGYMCMSTGLSYIADNNGQSAYTSVYTPSNGWVDVRYRWLTFGDSVTFLSDSNKDWFLGNADYQYGGSFAESSSSEQSSEQTSEDVSTSIEQTSSDDMSSTIEENSTLISFPADYNPIVMFGVPFEGYLFGKLSGESITGTNTGGVRKYLNGVFKIDNDIYDRIEIQFSSMSDRPYISTSGSVETYPHESPLETIFPLGIYARLFGTDSLTPLWQCGYTFANGQQALSRSGRWLNQDRQNILVLDYDPDEIGLSNMFPTYDTLQLLQVRSSSSQSIGVLGGNGNYDVFTLIGSAFNGIIPIFEIQLLPYLTIGTLLFVPLVVLLIFAILKVLNK